MIKMKFFTDPLEEMKPWINEIARQGYRLVSVNNFIFKFEETEEKYYYDTEFLGGNPSKENREYIEMLLASHYKTFIVPLNQGQVAFGKVRFKPFSKNTGKIATAFGNFGKEILIVESEEELKEEIVTNYSDVAAHYEITRNSYAQGMLVVLITFLFVLFLGFRNGWTTITIVVTAILALLTLFYLRLVLNTNKKFEKYVDKTNIRKW